MLLRHADLCSHGECACCEVCAVRDDMSPVMCACLRWVDQHDTWDITYVSAVCLWGAGYVYAACVLPLFVYDTPLGVSFGGGHAQAVCLCTCCGPTVCGTLCVTTCLPCVSLPSASCILYMACKSPRGVMCLHICVSMRYLRGCSDGRDDLYSMYLCAMNCIHVVVLCPVCC